jgi:hypothetical protein
MDEHERNLHDLYAGLAMMGLVTRYGDVEPVELAHKSFDIADTMLKVRKEIASATEETEEGTGAVSDVAVSDMEGREDRGAQGIAALKKTRTRSRSV